MQFIPHMFPPPPPPYLPFVVLWGFPLCVSCPKKSKEKFILGYLLFFSSSRLFFFVLDELFGFCFGYIQLLFLLFFTGCIYF